MLFPMLIGRTALGSGNRGRSLPPLPAGKGQGRRWRQGRGRMIQLEPWEGSNPPAMVRGEQSATAQPREEFDGAGRSDRSSSAPTCVPVRRGALLELAVGRSGALAGDGATGYSLAPPGDLAAALRQSRDALGRLEGELGGAAGRAARSGCGADAAAADRLRGAAKAAGLAFANLTGRLANAVRLRGLGPRALGPQVSRERGHERLHCG